MFRSMAKLAVRLDVDNAANRIVEGFYRNSPYVAPRFARRFQVLAYHKVSPDPHPFFEPDHPSVFEQHMQFLSRCYRVMPLMEIVERNRRGDIPHRAVAITFDDGYRDNYEYAFPILKKYGLSATIFVATGSIDTGEPLWHDRIFDSFRYTRREHVSLRHIGLRDFSLETDQLRRHSLAVVLTRAKELYGKARCKFVEEVEKTLKPNLPASLKHRMLTWQHIHEMGLHLAHIP